MIRFGVIGTGAISAAHIDSINKLEDASLTAVWSRTPEKAKQVAEREGCVAVSSIEELVNRDDVDARHDLHAVRGPYGAGAPRDRGRQACNHRETAGSDRRALPKDHRCRGSRRGKARRYFSKPLLSGERRVARSDSSRALRQIGDGGCIRQVVSSAVLLRQRRMARHVGARRRRGADESGDPHRGRPPFG